MIGYKIKNEAERTLNNASLAEVKRWRIHVNGIVQGVGFRPFIYNLAQILNIQGHIANNSSGVIIEAQQKESLLRQFIDRILSDSPPLSEITDLHYREIKPLAEDGFDIILSKNDPGNQTLISPDVSICDQCLKELFDPSNRRYHYPFINCTNCGPRYTIIKAIPYDRPNTTMSDFSLCPLCSEEYNNPANRRFHAQPNACPKCGPQIWYEEIKNNIQISGTEEVLDRTVNDIINGKIVAIKGLGGFHLAADATNGRAVSRLRQRKNRYQKPLALMVFDVKAARGIVHLDTSAEKLLSSAQRPIVLLPKKRNISVAEEAAPDNKRLGVMLPYTPLHYLLLDRLRSLAPGKPHMLVMTSANLSEEPIAIDNEDARLRLGKIADSFLFHNRDILIRADDSVLFLNEGKPQFLRRSRGYAPKPVFLNQSGPAVLAVGGQLKNTICLLKENKAFLSQHIGDLETYSAFKAFEQATDHLQKIFETRAEVVACDMHPGYSATQWALKQQNKKIVKIQHHHAHMASVMAEWQLDSPVIGLILDGSGYGYDGTIWGGEILTGDYLHIKRAAWLEALPLPGGEAAIKHPWRMAVSYLLYAFEGSLPELPFLKDVNAQPIVMMLQKNLNCPLTSSCGRLFDGIAAMSGGRLSVSYEAQAAIEMTQAVQDMEVLPYEFVPVLGAVPLARIIKGVVKDVQAGNSFAYIAARFHQTLIFLFDALLRAVREKTNLNRAVLSGGVFQNEILLAGLQKKLKASGFEVFSQRQVPANDGGLSLGQAAIARQLLVNDQNNVNYSVGI